MVVEDGLAVGLEDGLGGHVCWRMEGIKVWKGQVRKELDCGFEGEGRAAAAVAAVELTKEDADYVVGEETGN